VTGGHVSEWTAREVFGVVLDEDGEVDEAATAERREAEREARLDRGVPYEQFREEWAEKEPPEEALTFYGDWPEAMTDDESTTRIGAESAVVDGDD
ncbi:MAG: hypothetical protein ACOCS7_01575, partial [Halolamina sp.]